MMSYQLNVGLGVNLCSFWLGKKTALNETYLLEKLIS